VDAAEVEAAAEVVVGLQVPSVTLGALRGRRGHPGCCPEELEPQGKKGKLDRLSPYPLLVP